MNQLLKSIVAKAHQTPLLIFLLVCAVYLPIQEWLLLYVGDDATLSFAALPILFAGWWLGPLWAIAVGITAGACFSIIRFVSVGYGALMDISVGVTSLVIFMLIGLVIGKVEQLNRRLKKELEARKAAELALEFRSQQLSRSNQELEQFAYIASHDLQEPLRKISSFSDRLTTKYTMVLDDTGKDYLNRMQNAAMRMQDLIEGLLTYSRVSTKAQPFTTVSLSTVCNEVLNDLETAITDSRATITISGTLPTIEADALQIRQLMQNLIGNALKYRKLDALPLITIRATQTAETCTIAISDNGIGFEQKYADQIFGVFQRLHGRSSPYKGSGIGLSVCRKIVERHGGSIVATSEPDKGSVFTVTLPLLQRALDIRD